MTTSRLLAALASAGFFAVMVSSSGCAPKADTAVGPSGPPPTTQQRVQQIQSDPNIPQAVKDVRLHNAADAGGPPVRHAP